MLAAHLAQDADVTLAVVPNPAPVHYNGITVDAKDRVTGFVARGDGAAGSWHFVGVQFARRRVFDGLADGVPAETIAGIYRDLVATAPGRIRAWRATTDFIDVGTPRDYLRAALTFEPERRPGVRRSAIWPEARVAEDVALDGCVVAGPVRLPAGFRATDAVIVPAAVAGLNDAATIAGDIAVFPMGPYNGSRG
jgi:NDP-sugar pyrophosphorylase family protein